LNPMRNDSVIAVTSVSDPDPYAFGPP